MYKVLQVFITTYLLFFTIAQYTVKSIGLPKLITPTSTANEQATAATELIARVVGTETALRFVVTVDKSLMFRSYQITKDSQQRVHIVGWDGISVAKGFHYYLKYVLDEDVSWFDNAVKLSPTRNFPNITYTSESASAIIYYQNVCTWSYSFAWWSWISWRRHIDWMAMMGISLTLAPIQESIWDEIYTEFGLTEQEVAEHFAGPAFQAWQRMGNIRGWGGPLPATYRRMQSLLQKQIIQAQRALGMSVALPAFAGHVPIAFKRLYPNVTFTVVERWNHFPDDYCCGLFLEPTEPLFTEIGTKFVSRVIAAYGTNHIYFSDPFNEVNPRWPTRDYLSATASHIYDSMTRVDSQAVWLLQGWMFIKNPFWSDELIKSFLTAVPQGKLLVLDLQSEQFPQYQRTYSYYGQPFIWCMLHNFGGTLGMFGSVDIVNRHIEMAQTMANSTMIGVGITPEGIHQNYALYAFALERGWVQDDFDLSQWFAHFASVRYGVEDENLKQVWQILRQSVYSYNGLRKMRGKYTITRRPSLNIDTWVWYNTTDIEHALEMLLAANQTATIIKQNNYLHDIVDLTRQYLQNIADRLYVNLKSAYNKRQLQRFSYIADKLDTLIMQLESILATNEHFLLGPWLASAKKLALNDKEEKLFEFNARNQITGWGPNGQIIDYANKQWSGLVRDYYHPRWQLFLNETQRCLNTKEKFNNTAFKLMVADKIENPFNTQTKNYPVTGMGDTWRIAKKIFDTWNNSFRQNRFLHYNRLEVKIISETNDFT